MLCLLSFELLLAAPVAHGETSSFANTDKASLERVNARPKEGSKTCLWNFGPLAAPEWVDHLVLTARLNSGQSFDIAKDYPAIGAWTERIKALPVVDRARRVVGIVTLADFLRHADLDRHEGWPQRLRAFIRPSGATHGDKAEVVGQIMTRQVRVASAERPLAELLPLFAQGGHHHIPIVGPEARLVGMLTQSDVVSSLLRSG